MAAWPCIVYRRRRDRHLESRLRHDSWALQKYTFTLKQDGTNVTGKASVDTAGEIRQADFKDGKMAGDRFRSPSSGAIQGNDITVTFTGKVSGEEIKFTRAVGDFGTSEATAKREAVNCSGAACCREDHPDQGRTVRALYGF